MKFNLTKYLFTVLCISTIGCTKTNEEKDDKDYAEAIVFGRFISPGCFDSEFCVEIFKMDKNGLKEDTNDNFPDNSGYYNGNFAIALSQSDYSSIESLLRSNIPDELLQLNSGYVGSFPSWNTNNYYFEYKSSSIHKYWIIDGSFDGSLGSTLQNFIQQIQESVNIASN